MNRQFWDVDNCQTCEKLETENAKLRAELIQCREQLREQSKSFCTHCGTFFPSGKEGIERFREHIAECNSHPLNSMARELVSLRVDIERLQDELGKLTALRDAAVKRLGDMNDLLSRGKGTWPSNTYVRDTLWSAWQAEAFCLRMILAEAGIDSTREAAEAARTEVGE